MRLQPWNRRHLIERIMRLTMIGSLVIVALCLGAILWTIIVRGLPALTWQMISQTPKGGFYMGKGGGVLNAILGSLYLASGATAIAIVFALPIANVFGDLRLGAASAFGPRCVVGHPFDCLWSLWVYLDDCAGCSGIVAGRHYCAGAG